ncbi:hypothetical protein PIB30_035232 [Stylosanthes scabra]|uniref:Uncharacterized protein n=1 Tax=Stylosanthes scabra TaxID=79078 RepID=A0ABU6TDB0_9FABA|nr:hypothetical protein [Stylosanthes scabra]
MGDEHSMTSTTTDLHLPGGTRLVDCRNRADRLQATRRTVGDGDNNVTRMQFEKRLWRWGGGWPLSLISSGDDSFINVGMAAVVESSLSLLSGDSGNGDSGCSRCHFLLSLFHLLVWVIDELGLMLCFYLLGFEWVVCEKQP